MHYYRAIIQYAGTHYAGFQWQAGVSTIQGTINAALSTYGLKHFSTSGASRTDTGVHALAQVIKICSDRPLEVNHFIEPFNNLLPRDICFLTIEESDWSFRPASAVSRKEYRYLFTNDLQQSDFIANISNPLDLELMSIAAQLLEGTHDFCNFCSSGSNVKSTVRSIDICKLSQINPHHLLSDHSLFPIPSSLQHCYQLQIVGNGFLKQMVRHIMRALWMLGSGKITMNQFQEYLDGPKQNKQLWKVAPPNGLYKLV